MARWFLGLDSSTQSLAAILIDPEARAIVAERSVNFDAELPDYGTRNGVLRAADPTVVHAPPLMWAAALDRMFERLRAEGRSLANVVAVAVSGQQQRKKCFCAGADEIMKALLLDKAHRVHSVARRMTPQAETPPKKRLHAHTAKAMRGRVNTTEMLDV